MSEESTPGYKAIGAKSDTSSPAEPGQPSAQQHSHRIRKRRKVKTTRKKIEERFEVLFGGRSLGNVAAAIFLVLSIFLGVWVTIQTSF